jgi:hypothetical protein
VSSFITKEAQKVLYEPKLSDFQAASIEFLFRELSAVVIAEAERQSGILFGQDDAFDDMITVHLR